MAISRRKFAQTVGLALAGTTLAGSAGNVFSQTSGPGDLFQLPGEAYSDQVLSFNSDLFRPFIGTLFQPDQNNSRKPSLQLVEVAISEIKSKKQVNVTGESFSLIFRSVGRNKLPEETHMFQHGSLGTFAIFISPVERDRRTYQAVINHQAKI
jgi:hypothetical protein